MTLDDLERPKNVTLAEIKQFYRAHIRRKSRGLNRRSSVAYYKLNYFENFNQLYSNSSFF